MLGHHGLDQALGHDLAVFVGADGVRGREPFVTTTGLKLAKDHMFFTSAKAERELGYQARPYGEAVAEAIAWFRQHGYLKA